MANFGQNIIVSDPTLMQKQPTFGQNGLLYQKFLSAKMQLKAGMLMQYF